MFLDFQQKRKIRSVLYSRVSIFLLFILFLYSLYSTFLVYKKRADSKMELFKLEKEYTDLQIKQNSVISQIEDLNSGEGIEREIREKFGVAKKDENLVMIVSEKPNKEKDKKETSFWQKVVSFLGF